jgi:GNAT superfamily N-acetyltransferase
LAKPWFEHESLIVACDGARPVGFAHAGFGPTADFSDIDRHQGTTGLVLVAPHEKRTEIACELLSASEDYLRRRGAQQLFAGWQAPFNPYFSGIYGGSEVPGVLASDVAFVELLKGAAYEPSREVVLLHRALAGFKAPVDRQWMQVRRKFVVPEPCDALPDNWWDANVWAWHDWTRYILTLPGGGEPIISATFWDIEPLGRGWGVQAVGLARLDDTPEAREQGLTAYLLGEALRLYAAQGYTHFEAQAAASDDTLLEMFARLGIESYDRAALWRKTS